MILVIARFFISALLIISTPLLNAEPKRVMRYDDANDFLPNAQRRNVEGIRLFLKQQENEIRFEVRPKRNVAIDIIANIPADAEFGIIFLLGGTSVLSIVDGKLDRSFSFQPRSRDFWWKHKYATFLVDAQSDKLDESGISDINWRAGTEHLSDLEAVVNAISERFKGPLVIHGQSLGAISLVNIAQLNPLNVKAYIYTGAVFNTQEGELIANFNHGRPVLLVHHRKDRCAASPAVRAEQFFQRMKNPTKDLIWIEGGVEPMSGECGPFSPHSFVGREEFVISEIVNRLKLWLR